MDIVFIIGVTDVVVGIAEVLQILGITDIGVG